MPEPRPAGAPRPAAEHLAPYRWRKGQSGNPGGRPAGDSLTARLRRVLEQEHHGRELLDLLAERVAREALAGKFPFVKEVLERLDGRVTEKQEVEMRHHRVIRVVLEGDPAEEGKTDGA